MPFLSLILYSPTIADKHNYWKEQRKGANFFNKTPQLEWFASAKEIGIQFDRLAPDK